MDRLPNISKFIRKTFHTENYIPLHEPLFIGNEKKYLNECIDSTFVSSVGKFVDEAERKIEKYTGCKKAIICVNGTSALHIALVLAGVENNSEVITQPLTFVATCNAISYCGATPHFVDVDKDTLGLSPIALKNQLKEIAEIKNGICYNKNTGCKITACVPMHTFGFPCRIDEIVEICKEYHIAVIEDAAESLGSKYKNQHTGTFGKMGILSFNGNKIITAGGGGAILTNDDNIGEKAKHITTTAKVSHKWEYYHNQIGYNYRMPNLNAALLCAQLENLDTFIEKKRALADSYKHFFKEKDINFITETKKSFSNYWLMTVCLNSKEERDEFLTYTNKNGIMTRPIWKLMNNLPMYQNSPCGDLENAKWLEERIVNIPSSVILKKDE